jgi:fucose permease
MKSTSAKVILLLAFLLYLLFGMFTGAVGPVLGELAQQTSSTLAAIGGVVTFLFLGSLIAQIAAGPLTDRLGEKPVLLVSILVLSAGIIGLTSAQALAMMFVLALLTGLGQGGVDMVANLVVADAAPKNSTSALNLLHFFFGLGAFVGPALVALAIGGLGTGLIVHRGVAACFVLLALAILWLLPGRPAHAAVQQSSTGGTSGGPSVYVSPLVWLMGGLLLVYVGVEFSLGSWIPSYTRITTGATAANGAWITSLYWAALAIGRLVAAPISRRLSRIRLLSAALAGSLLGGIGLLVSHTMILPTVFFLLWISFSYGTVYPTTISLATASFQNDKGKAVGVLVAMGTMGGIALPWIAGLILDRLSSLAYLWLVLLLIAILVVVVFLIGRRLSRSPLLHVT